MLISRAGSSYNTFPTLEEGSRTPMAWSAASSLLRLPSIRPRRRDFIDYIGPILLVIFIACAIALAFTGGASIPPPPILRRKPKRHVLLTCFDEQLTTKINPSFAVAKSLNNSCDRIVCFKALCVRADQKGVSAAVSGIRNSNYVAVLILGYREKSKGFKLDVMARNINFTDQAVTRNEQHNTPSIAEGPRVLVTTAPLEKLSLRILNPRFYVDGLWSGNISSATDNELYYRALLMAREVNTNHSQTNFLKPTLYVHVPSLNQIRLDDVGKVIMKLAAAMLQ